MFALGPHGLDEREGRAIFGRWVPPRKLDGDVSLRKVGFVWPSLPVVAAIVVLASASCADASTGFPPDNWTGSRSQTGPLRYRGGPVMRSNNVFAIYWAPAGSYMQPGYTTFVDRYLSDVAGASGSRSNIYGVSDAIR